MSAATVMVAENPTIRPGRLRAHLMVVPRCPLCMLGPMSYLTRVLKRTVDRTWPQWIVVVVLVIIGAFYVPILLAAVAVTIIGVAVAAIQVHREDIAARKLAEQADLDAQRRDEQQAEEADLAAQRDAEQEAEERRRELEMIGKLVVVIDDALDEAEPFQHIPRVPHVYPDRAKRTERDQIITWIESTGRQLMEISAEAAAEFGDASDIDRGDRPDRVRCGEQARERMERLRGMRNKLQVRRDHLIDTEKTLSE